MLELEEGVELVDVPEEVTALGVDHIYGGDVVPRGAERVESRVLARYIVPGAAPLKHGIVPIAELMLPSGNLHGDLDEVCSDEVTVLPFRMNAYANDTYALKHTNNLYAIVRNQRPEEIRRNSLCVIQLDENRAWEYFFGIVRELNYSVATIERPDGDVKCFSTGDLRFIGCVKYWWMDGITGEVWIERDISGKARALLGINEDGELVSDAVAKRAAYKHN